MRECLLKGDYKGIPFFFKNMEDSTPGHWFSYELPWFLPSQTGQYLVKIFSHCPRFQLNILVFAATTLEMSVS